MDLLKAIILFAIMIFLYSNVIAQGVGDLPTCNVNQDGTPKTCEYPTDCQTCYQEKYDCFGNVTYPVGNPTEITTETTTETGETVTTTETYNYPFVTEGRPYTRRLQIGYTADYDCVNHQCVVTSRERTSVECPMGCDIGINNCVCPNRRETRAFCKPGSPHIWMEKQKWDCTMEEKIYRLCPIHQECRESSEHPGAYNCFDKDSPNPIQGPDGQWYASTQNSSALGTSYASRPSSPLSGVSVRVSTSKAASTYLNGYQVISAARASSTGTGTFTPRTSTIASSAPRANYYTQPAINTGGTTSTARVISARTSTPTTRLATARVTTRALATKTKKTLAPRTTIARTTRTATASRTATRVTRGLA